MRTAKEDIFYVTSEGSIVDQDNALLYESFCLEGFTQTAKERLAELHTLHSDDPVFDWFAAAEILAHEGHYYRDEKGVYRNADYQNCKEA